MIHFSGERGESWKFQTLITDAAGFVVVMSVESIVRSMETDCRDQLILNQYNIVGDSLHYCFRLQTVTVCVMTTLTCYQALSSGK